MPADMPQPGETPRAGAMRPRCTRHNRDMEPWSRVDGTSGAMGWSCPQCGAEAVERQAQEDHARTDQQLREAARQRKIAELEKRIGAAAIPARFRDITFDGFPVERVVEPHHSRAVRALQAMRSYANRWMEARKRGVSAILMGPVGTGKSGLAVALANHIIREEGATALFISAYGAVRHLRDTWGRRGRTEREALDDLISPDLLILDEVGATVGTDAEMTALFEIINGRYQDRRPTILLSNLPMDDWTDGAGTTRPGLRAFLGDRIVDRFRDDGSFILPMQWPSLRGGGSA